MSQPCPQEDLDGDDRYMSLHNRFVSEAKSNEPDVVFLGDSHIALLEQSEFYEQMLAPFHCLCFGVRGDTTYNLRWRLINGEIELVNPKVFVLLVGTNNRGETASQTLTEIKGIVELLSEKQPQAALLVLKIPPRGQFPNAKREILAELNANLAETLKTIPKCQVIDTDAGFVAADGTISHHDMYDYLHFTNLGYKKAFEAVHAAIQAIIYPESS